MKVIFKDEWKTWLLTCLAGGNKSRDERTFYVLFGFDSHDGRRNNWMSVSSAFIEYSHEREIELLKSHITNTLNVNDGDDGDSGGGNNSRKLYAGRPVYDMCQLLPPEADELLFREKLVNVLWFCYIYSMSNMPYVLASGTHPMIADDFLPIAPSGFRKHSHVPLLPSNNMTLVSRHAIPYARKLCISLLNRESSMPLNPTVDLGRAVAECMTHSSLNDERAIIMWPESDIECLDRHIFRLFMRNNTNTEERCGLCDEKLDV